MKQSEFTATTCNLLPAQEISWLQGAMHTASYWLKNWCSNIWYITTAQLLLTVIYFKPAPNQSDLSLTSGRGGGPSSNILLKIGMRKAAVFPDPITKVNFFLSQHENKVHKSTQEINLISLPQLDNFSCAFLLPILSLQKEIKYIYCACTSSYKTTVSLGEFLYKYKNATFSSDFVYI